MYKFESKYIHIHYFFFCVHFHCKYDFVFIQINSNENFSQWICKECITKVSKAFNFRKQCWEADEFLRTSGLEEVSTQNYEDDQILNSTDKTNYDDAIENDETKNNIKNVEPDSYKDTEKFDVVLEDVIKCHTIENSPESLVENDLIFESDLIPEPSNEISIDLNCDDEDLKTLTDIDAYVDALINDTYLNIYPDDNEFELLDKIFASTSCDSPEDVDKMILDFVNDFEGNKDIKKTKKSLKKKNKSRKRNNECEWVCQHCGKNFYKKSSYATHILGHKNPQYTRIFSEQNRGDFECSFCGKRYTNKIPFKTHLKIHDENNPNKCDICGKICTAPSLLEYHKFSHNVSNQIRFECNKCGKNLFNKADLTAHLKFHTGNKPFSCTICDKAFYTKSHLRGHIEIHSTEKKYKCDICFKFFKTKRLMKHHEKLHDNNNRKELKCTYCNKTYKTKRKKIEHMVKHPQYKSFSCRFCFKAYMSQSNLDTHIRIYHTDLITRKN